MEHTPGSVVASQFRQACIDFNIKNRRKVADLTRTLDSTAQALVPSIAIRCVHHPIFREEEKMKEKESLRMERAVVLLRCARSKIIY